jgi:hypothetical protein
MDLSTEVINYLAFLLPLTVAAGTLFLPGDSHQRRLVRVVIPAFCSVLVVGFGLQGLVRGCFDSVPVCPDGSSALQVIGNTFGSQVECMRCLPVSGSLAYSLNTARPYAVIISSILGCQISAFAIILFARWVRRTSSGS